MTITAVSADGVGHQFPDGTPDAVIDKTMRAYAGQTASKPSDAAPNPWIDAARAIPGGIAKGVSAVAGLPGDLDQLAQYGIGKAADFVFGAPSTPTRQAPYAPHVPTSGDIDSVLSAPTGGYYKPQTTAGRYAETIASFAPAALGGEASIPARALRMAVPAVASQAGGDLAGSIDPGLEPYGRFVGAVAGGGALAAGRPIARSINSIASATTGKSFLDPAVEAQRRIGSAISSDGGIAPITAKAQNFADTGASSPALIDVGGLNVRRLVRAAAAPEGPAQNTALSYADKIRANLQDNVTDRARQLTPNTPQNAAEYGAELERTQGANARTNYGGPNGPYAQPAQVTPEMVSALQGPEGRGAISRAYVAARANRDVQAMSELQDLQDVASNRGATPDPLTGRKRGLADALASLSSGSLDRVRIAMRNIGMDLASGPTPKRDIAGGYFGRVKDIDTALDQTPWLADARAAYRGDQAVRDAVPLGQSALNLPSNEYSAEIGRLSGVNPAARYAAGVGHRQAIVDAVEAPSAGATGVLNRIASSNRSTANLQTSFGAEGSRFQGAVQNEVDRLNNARFILPNTGSQTATRLMDQSLVALTHVPSSKVAWVAGLIDKVRSGAATLTAAERAEIVRLGVSEANLNALAQLPRGKSLSTLIAPAIAAGSGRRTQP